MGARTHGFLPGGCRDLARYGRETNHEHTRHIIPRRHSYHLGTPTSQRIGTPLQSFATSRVAGSTGFDPLEQQCWPLCEAHCRAEGAPCLPGAQNIWLL